MSLTYKFFLQEIRTIKSDPEFLTWSENLERALTDAGLDAIVRFGEKSIKDALLDNPEEPFFPETKYGPSQILGEAVIIIREARGHFYDPNSKQWIDIFCGELGTRMFWLCLKPIHGGLDYLGDKIVIGEQFTNSVKTFESPNSTHPLPPLCNADELVVFVSTLCKTSRWTDSKPGKLRKASELGLSYFVPFYSSSEAFSKSEDCLLYNFSSGWELVGDGADYNSIDYDPSALLLWTEAHQLMEPIRRHAREDYVWPVGHFGILTSRPPAFEDYSIEHRQQYGEELKKICSELHDIYLKGLQTETELRAHYSRIFERGKELARLDPERLRNSLVVEFVNKNGERTLQVLVVFPKAIDSNYLKEENNPKGYSQLKCYINGLFRGEPSENNEFDCPIEIPNLSDQRRILMELRYDRFWLDRKARTLVEPRTRQPLLSPTQYLSLIQLRAALLDRVCSGDTEFEDNLKRVVKPLPFFFEDSLLRFERSDEWGVRDNAITCFGSILRVSCLVGLEELHFRRNRIDSLQQAPDNLLDALARRPSFGHWSQCLDYLVKIKCDLPVWGNWISIVKQSLSEHEDLIEIRNRWAHPERHLSLQEEEKNIERFRSFFRRLIPDLRAEAEKTSFRLVINREVLSDVDGQALHRLKILNLNTASKPFPSGSMDVNQDFGNQFVDRSLFCQGPTGIFLLNNFFITSFPRHGEPAIFVYEREYSGESAVAVDVMKGVSVESAFPAGIFTFA